MLLPLLQNNLLTTGGGVNYTASGSAGVYALTVKQAEATYTPGQIIAGGYSRHSQWVPYLMDAQEWKKKIPPKVVQAIERVARSDKTGEKAEKALLAEIEDAKAVYFTLLHELQQSQLHSIALLKKQRLKEIQDAEDEDFMMMM